MIYADTSALLRAYFVDEPEQPDLERLLIQADEPVLTSEIARVEFGGAAFRAARSGRIRAATELISLFDRDSGPGAAISLVPFDRGAVLAEAHRLCVAHGLRALDSIHLAVALGERSRAEPGNRGADFVFVTRDAHQAGAARAEGLAVG